MAPGENEFDTPGLTQQQHLLYLYFLYICCRLRILEWLMWVVQDLSQGYSQGVGWSYTI